MAISPTGTHAMGRNSTTPYKSTDSLATWQSVAAAIPIGSDVWESCKNDFMYIFGGGIVVKLTMDGGATVPIDKAGNLTAIAALIDVNILRFLS